VIDNLVGVLAMHTFGMVQHQNLTMQH